MIAQARQSAVFLRGRSRLPLAEGAQEGAHGVGRGRQDFRLGRGAAEHQGHLQIGIDQGQELPGGDVGIVDVEIAGIGEPGEARGERRPGLAGTVLAPVREQFGIALALGLDQPAQELAVAIADAVAVQPEGEGDEVGFEILWLVGKGGERGEEAGIGALGDVAHDSNEQVFLVAMMIVDGLARDAGLGSDQVDIGAAEAFAAEHLTPQRRLSTARLAAWPRGGQGVRRNVSAVIKNYIDVIDELDKSV